MKYILISILILFLSSCDGGLEPISVEQKAKLDVTLKFVDAGNNWPPKDSIIGLRIAAFKKMPDTSIINDIIAGNAYFTFNSLPLFVDSTGTRFEISDSPVDLVYIAAVQQYDSLITSQRVIGIFSITGDKTKPSSLLIEPGKQYSIKIDIDFNDLPPMPF